MSHSLLVQFGLSTGMLVACVFLHGLGLASLSKDEKERILWRNVEGLLGL